MITRPNAEKGVLVHGLAPERLKSTLRRVLEQVFADPDQISRYFADDYIQTTDGTTCDREGFEQHIRHLASAVQSIQFEVLEALQQGQRIADRHLAHVAYRDGRRATIEVYLIGTTRDGRWHRVHEITRVVSGDRTLKSAAIARE